MNPRPEAQSPGVREGGAAEGEPRPSWSRALRALREARGVTQAGWAAQLGVARSTLQRWEQGELPPDPHAEAALLALCEEKGLFRTFTQGPLAGVTVTPAWLADLLAEARLGRAAAPEPAGEGSVPSRRPSGQLPVPLSSFVGREQELAAVARLLGMSRLLTLTGAGGIGKTRLALAVAAKCQDAYPDGVWFVDLSPIEDPTLVLTAVAQVLGVRETAGQPLAERLTAFLRERHLLLVVDNFEQVIEGASLLRDLLTASLHLTLLVTSRVLLRLSGEHEHAVPPLAVPPTASAIVDASALMEVPSVALFVQRAQIVKPGFALTAENAPTVAEICKRLDGLPLALELAAARIRVLTPDALRARLDHQLALLTGGARDLPRRQQTLRDTIQWSFDLLTDGERALFRRLAVFAGGCTLEAAEAVCAAERDHGIDALDGLTSLVEKSLLGVEDGPDGERRFTMLAPLREFAWEHLAVSGEADSVQRVHAHFFAERAGTINRMVKSPQYEAALAQARGEQDNFRAVLTWAIEQDDAGLGIHLLDRLTHAWFWLGLVAEGRHWAERLLAVPSAADWSAARARALTLTAFCARLQGHLSGVREQHAESVAIAREHNDAALLAWTLLWMGRDMVSSDRAAALAMLEESVVLFRTSGEPNECAAPLWVLGQALLDDGDYERARQALEESLALYQTEGYLLGAAVPLELLARLAVQEGDTATARTLYEEVLPYNRVWINTNTPAILNQLGRLLLRQGEEHRATALLEEAMETAQQLDAKPSIIATIDGLACLLSRTDHERATRLFGSAEGLRSTLGIPAPPDTAAEDALHIEHLRASLGDAAFTTAWAEGRALSLDAAVALALAQTDLSALSAAQ